MHSPGDCTIQSFIESMDTVATDFMALLSAGRRAHGTGETPLQQQHLGYDMNRARDRR